jgi:hypothetical protein
MRRIVRRCGPWLLAAVMLVGCTSRQGPDMPAVGPAPEGAAPLTSPPPVERGYQLAHKARPWEDATVVEYAADFGRTGRFIAYYAVRAREPSPAAPATIGMGCVLGPQAGGPVARAGARLLATVDGLRVDFGPLEYQPGIGADAYWREGVPYAEARRLAGTAVHLSCADVEFTLSPRQAQGLRRFFGQEGEAER